MDEMRTLRVTRPEPGERSLSAARDRLTEETARRGRRSIPLRLPAPRRAVARVATAGTLAVFVAAGLTVSQVVNLGGDPPTDLGGGKAGGGPAAVANAAVLLDRAAAATPDYGSAEPDDFGYVESRIVYYERPSPLSGDEPEQVHLKQWLSVDGSRPGLLRGKATPAKAAMYIPDVRADPGDPKTTKKWQDQRIAAEDDPQAPWQPSLLRPNHAYLKSLPHDPDALAAKVRETCAGLDHGCNLGGFEVISHVLADGVVPPEVRSGLLKAAKHIEGIELIENVGLAATGEHGVAIAYTAGPDQEGSGFRFELVFDPETYEILGTQQVSVEGRTPPSPAPPGASKIEPGTVVSSTAILDKGIVDKVGQRP